jgi:hypothetical protein
MLQKICVVIHRRNKLTNKLFNMAVLLSLTMADCTPITFKIDMCLEIDVFKLNEFSLFSFFKRLSFY